MCFFPLKVLYFHFNVSTCAYGHTASRMVLGRTPQPIDIVVFKFVIGSKIKKMIATEKQTRQLLVFNLFSISSGSETACWRSPATYPCSPWRGFWKIRSDFCCSPSEWRLNRKKWLNSAGLHGLWPVRSKWVVYFRPWFPVACQQPSSPAAREATSSLAATREAGRSSAWFDKELNLLTTGAETTAWFFFPYPHHQVYFILGRKALVFEVKDQVVFRTTWLLPSWANSSLGPYSWLGVLSQFVFAFCFI